MVEVSHEEFSELVALALDSIPLELAARMDNVAVVVEDMGSSPNLLGLYHGIPLTVRGNDYGGMAMPDRISIYRLPICRISGSEAQVIEQVRRTVIHEVAHHFGISDPRLTELGWN